MLRPLALAALLLAALPIPGRSDVTEALSQAREHLARGRTDDAITALEAALPSAPEDRLPELLETLRGAYEAAIRRAEADGRTRDASLLRDNLAIIAGPDSSRPAVVEPPVPPRLSPERESTEAKATEPRAVADSSPDTNEARPDEEALPEPKSTPTRDLAVADAAFRAKKYDEAGSIYAELARAGRLPEVRRDPWAYCRMVAVVDRINAGARTDADWARLRAEIDAIRKLSPKNWYAEYLRNLAAELTAKPRRPRDGRPVLRGASPEERRRDEQASAADRPIPDQTRTRRFVAASSPSESQPAAESAPAAPQTVGRAGQPIGNWRVWETDNFRILHADDALAQKVAQVAEASRNAQARRWIGPQPPAVWSPRCDIYLYPTAAVFSEQTGQPQDSPGFSTMGLNSGRVIARRVNLRADHPNLVTAVLPHEITHVVLADIFNDVQVPRWADEGIAVLSEPRTEQELRAADLNQPLADNRLFRLADLMSMDYPDGRYWSLYYAQSVSLTRFLVEQGSPAKFVEFVRGSQRAGVEAELKRVYGIRDLADLQSRWLAYARSRSNQLAAAEPLGASR